MQKIKVSEAVAEYLALNTARRGEAGRATTAGDTVVLNMFVRIAGDRIAHNLTGEHIESFFYGPGGIRSDHKVMSTRVSRNRTLTAPPVAESTHNHYRSRLKVFISWAVNKGYMKPGLVGEAFDNSNGLVRPLKPRKSTRQRPTPATLLSLLDQADNPRDRCYLAVAINTGLRANEIRRIRIGEVDLDAGYMSVTISKTRDVDEQPIPLELDQELRRWLTSYTAAALDIGAGALQPEHFLFPTRRGGLISHYEYDEEMNRVPVRHQFYWVPESPLRESHKIVQRALAALGLPTQKEGTHTIRRAVALAYFQEVAKDQGDVAALRETAAFLHHSSVVTTEIYLGMTPEKNRRNQRLKGKPFLTAMIDQTNVVPLRSTGTGE